MTNFGGYKIFRPRLTNYIYGDASPVALTPLVLLRSESVKTLHLGFRPPPHLGELGLTTFVDGSLEKPVCDFLLVIIEPFFAICYG